MGISENSDFGMLYSDMEKIVKNRLEERNLDNLYEFAIRPSEEGVIIQLTQKIPWDEM